ncbi:MAG TPA: phosphotransferase family protein [Micromonosporaceae bacterium]|nr:phosphotransferase family protein [Micromonosporaceae bacterium]
MAHGNPHPDPPGVDLAKLEAYLKVACPDLAAGQLGGPLAGELIAGGKSNLTYRIWGADRGSTVVLRRPPLGHVLPTAHDMAREYRVIAALHPTGFPVPTPIHLCPDADVIGAPFYVMSYVDGVVLRDQAQTDALTPEDAGRAGDLLVETLAQLHGTDPAAVGLADFGRPDGYLERQVRRWYQQWERSKTRELPTLDAVADALRSQLPSGGRTGIVHGDYRLDNVMFDVSVRRILAVLDWEMATLGDTLADLGLLVVYSELAAEGLAPTPSRLSPERGFRSGEQLVERYWEYAGAHPRPIGWYVALGYYKLAIISEGIHARYLQGKTVGPGFELVGERVPELVDRAQAALGTGRA